MVSFVDEQILSDRARAFGSFAFVGAKGHAESPGKRSVVRRDNSASRSFL